MAQIYIVRGQKVMLDRGLAILFGIESKRLKEQVRRNISRFPKDFMFEMTKEELENWRSQFATSNKEVMGLRRPPFAFTEHGVLMLSSVLNSDRAEVLLTHKDLLLKIEKAERKLSKHDDEIKLIFKAIHELLSDNKQKKIQESRKRIGFNKDK